MDRKTFFVCFASWTCGIMVGMLILIATGNVCPKELHQDNEIVMIDLYGAVDIDYKETDIGFDNLLICNMTSGRCGNDVYYNSGKGFIWGGLHNASGITVSAKIHKFALEVQDE